MENNRECYHCAANHPELTVPLFAYGFGFSPKTLDEAGRADAARYQALVTQSHDRWEAAGLPSREIEHMAGRATGFRTERLPMDQAGESQTLNTRAASKKPLGRINDLKLGGLSFWTQPNSWHHFMSDHVVTFCVIPLTAESTLLRTKWLVHKDAVEGEDYDLDNLTVVWDGHQQPRTPIWWRSRNAARVARPMSPAPILRIQRDWSRRTASGISNGSPPVSPRDHALRSSPRRLGPRDRRHPGAALRRARQEPS